MVTENVDVRFRESGAVVVKRRIDAIGNAANRATRGIFLLQRAIFVLGGAGIVSGLVRYVDALTAMENRLRLTSNSTENLEAVQDRLLAAANRSRTDFLALGEIYTRMALSARDLGASQQEILDFTETLSKASIISGASAQEARAALIQLGQGLASNRLSGDELRSILEQLPFVADIIAKDIGVTRGELRQLGSDGKLTAEVVLDAFRNAKDEIDALFETTQPTIGQAFAVAKNNLLAFIDRIDDATSASARIANAIISLSKALDIMLGLLAIVAVKFAAAFALSIVQRIISIVNGIQRLGGATAVLNAIEAKRAMNSIALRSASAAEAASEMRTFQIRQARIAQSLLLRQTEFAEAAAAFQNGRARDLQTGKFISIAGARDRLAQATIRLTAAERANSIATAQLNSLRGATVVAENAVTASKTRLTAATVAQTTVLSRLSATFPFLTGVVVGTSSAIRGLFLLLAANPIGAVITAILAITTAFVFWGNEIKITSDGVVGLKDAVVAAFQLMSEAVAPFLGPIWEGIKRAVGATKNALVSAAIAIATAFFDTVENIVDAFTFLPRVVVGTVVGVVSALKSMPGQAGEVAMQVANVLIDGFESFANGAIQAINKVISALNRLLSFVGADKAAEWFGFSGQISELGEVTLPRFQAAAGESGKAAADAFVDGFNTVFEGGKVSNLAESALNALAPIGDRIIKRARENIANQSDGEITTGDRPPGDGLPGDGGGSSSKKSFAQEIADLKAMIELEKQYGLEKLIFSQILKTENEIKRQLTETERSQIAQMVTLIEVSKVRGQTLEEIRGPQEKLIITQKALNELLAEGAISSDQFSSRLRQVRIEALKAEETFAGSFKAALLENIQTASDLGKAFGDKVVQGIDKASEAFADFTVESKGDFSSLVSSILKDFARLAAQSAFKSFFNFTGLGRIFSGFFDTGGFIPSGKIGITGEKGPEIVSGPAMVTSRQTTSDLMNRSNSNSKSEIVLRVISDEKITVEDVTTIAANVSLKINAESTRASRKNMPIQLATIQERGV